MLVLGKMGERKKEVNWNGMVMEGDKIWIKILLCNKCEREKDSYLYRIYNNYRKVKNSDKRFISEGRSRYDMQYKGSKKCMKRFTVICTITHCA